MRFQCHSLFRLIGILNHDRGTHPVKTRTDFIDLAEDHMLNINLIWWYQPPRPLTPKTGGSFRYTKSFRYTNAYH